jgi:hypothetical protein
VILDWGENHIERIVGVGYYYLGEQRMWALHLGRYWFAAGVR